MAPIRSRIRRSVIVAALLFTVLHPGTVAAQTSEPVALLEVDDARITGDGPWISWLGGSAEAFQVVPRPAAFEPGERSLSGASLGVEHAAFAAQVDVLVEALHRLGVEDAARVDRDGAGEASAATLVFAHDEDLGALRQRADFPSALVQEHVHWALARHAA